jgi:DNA-binding NtrC family response regulator
MHILIIDDEDVIRSTVGEILSAEGYDVTLASNGAEGLKRVREGSFDLVITDLFMPEKDGVEVVLELRKSHPHIKIITMSGGGSFRNTASLKTARMLGSTFTIEKPFTASELLDLVQKSLAKGNR